MLLHISVMGYLHNLGQRLYKMGIWIHKKALFKRNLCREGNNRKICGSDMNK